MLCIYKMNVLDKVIELNQKTRPIYTSDVTDEIHETKLMQSLRDLLFKFNKNELITAITGHKYKRIYGYQTTYNQTYNLEKEFDNDIQTKKIQKKYIVQDFTHIIDNMEFFKSIKQQQYKQKILFKFWKSYETRLKTMIREQYNRSSVQLRPSMNKFIFLPHQDHFTFTDLITANRSVSFHEDETKYNLHHIILGGLLNKTLRRDIRYDYTPYTHKIEPHMIYQFSDGSQEIFGHTHLYIKPIGFYTIFSNEKVPTNIDCIYYDTGGVAHTKNDIIIFEINDYQVFDYEQKLEEVLSNNFEMEDTNDFITNAPTKKTKRKRNKKNKYNSVDNELVKMIYDTDESGSDKDEVVRDIPVNFSRYVNEKFKQKISDLVSKAIRKQSKFYDLVKAQDDVYVTASIHNSFHKTEPYNHFIYSPYIKYYM